MAASGTHRLLTRLLSFLRRRWRSILWGIVKGFVVLFVALEAFLLLTESISGPAGHTTALLVVALSCTSLAYWLFVSSRVRITLPGIGEKLAEVEAKSGSGAEGRSTEPAGETATIEIRRLSAQVARARVVNDTPLPVLRAQASVTIVREPEDGKDPAGEDARPAMGPSFALRARASRTVDLAESFDHVGIYLLKGAGVRVYSPFGLLSRVRGVAGRLRVRVVPNIYRIPSGVPRDRTVLQSSLGIPDAPADALDYDRVREYRPGDPLKTIHWKLVAHSQGELLTKLFETSTITTVTLTIDPFCFLGSTSSETASHLYDTLLEGAFSLIEHARQNGITGRLRFERRDSTLVETTWVGPALCGWFVEMARRPGNAHEDATKSIIAIRAMQNAREGYAVFATSGLSEASVGALIACHHAGVPLVVVHALPESGTESSHQRTFDERLRAASVTVVALTDGFQIVQEVSA